MPILIHVAHQLLSAGSSPSRRSGTDVLGLGNGQSFRKYIVISDSFPKFKDISNMQIRESVPARVSEVLKDTSTLQQCQKTVFSKHYAELFFKGVPGKRPTRRRVDPFL